MHAAGAIRIIWFQNVLVLIFDDLIERNVFFFKWNRLRNMGFYKCSFLICQELKRPFQMQHVEDIFVMNDLGTEGTCQEEGIVANGLKEWLHFFCMIDNIGCDGSPVHGIDHMSRRRDQFSVLILQLTDIADFAVISRFLEMTGKLLKLS